MMLRSTAAALILALASASGVGAQDRRAPASDPERAAPWQDPGRWRQLRLGMTQSEVLQILGEPGKVTRYYAFERWEYPDALGQRVNFDERSRLSVWGAYAR
jgi:outer membrane protein assembly factor BamE (lipoprotein component of BamABCDE complex)